MVSYPLGRRAFLLDLIAIVDVVDPRRNCSGAHVRVNGRYQGQVCGQVRVVFSILMVGDVYRLEIVVFSVKG